MQNAVRRRAGQHAARQPSSRTSRRSRGPRRRRDDARSGRAGVARPLPGRVVARAPGKTPSATENTQTGAAERTCTPLRCAFPSTAADTQGTHAGSKIPRGRLDKARAAARHRLRDAPGCTAAAQARSHAMRETAAAARGRCTAARQGQGRGRSAAIAHGDNWLYDTRTCSSRRAASHPHSPGPPPANRGARGRRARRFAQSTMKRPRKRPIPTLQIRRGRHLRHVRAHASAPWN